MEQTQAIPATAETSSLAIFSLIFGVLSWTVLPVIGLVLTSFFIFGLIALPLTGSVIASVCGWMAQKQIRQSNGQLRGAGLAKAGRIMAYTQYILFAIFMVFILLQITLAGHRSI